MADALHVADREVATLSGGEQARVHLAAAFAQLWEAEYPHPRFLLLDEPTAALDLAHQPVLQTATITRGFGVASHVLRHPLTQGMLIATAAIR